MSESRSQKNEAKWGCKDDVQWWIVEEVIKKEHVGTLSDRGVIL